ncbi:MAG TPA: imidazolonepropionase [Catalimonadaceae bacterium]|nr:imidazolonepropionase [Catalimonadaceae bacterium]
MSRETIITNIKGLWLPIHSDIRVIRGSELNKTNLLENAWLLIRDGIIQGFGQMDSLETDVPENSRLAANRINADGRFVLPSFCDAHSHLVFAAWRENEMEMRLQGKTYLEIAEQGGGILNSARRLEETPEEILFEAAWNRLQELIRLGTGALEIKSGYGLSLEAELKMLRVIRSIREKSPIPIRATFLGAHAIPKRFNHRHEYIELVTQSMIPAVAEQGLADYCDVFCDKGFFTQEETEEILEQGLRYGLKPKVHANELARSGGVQAGVKLGAVSVDHLECMEEEELLLLAGSNTIPVLLPGTAFFLGIHPPDARSMIAYDLPVALSSDYNPGTCPSGNMEFVVSMASTMLKMQVSEALHAATVNSSFAMNLENETGRIAVGRKANLLITKQIPSLSFMPYHFGQSSIDTVLVNGEKV